ncbi:MAG: FAD-dependent oxidoreductase [Thermodesulfobacteriota bacterium]|nr:FAD-dependent oxidoreductase [Thermodesulfobacteriota bacterium]
MRDDLKVLVIGGVACGPKAASRLKRLMPHADVTLIERDDVVSYGVCGLPYYVEGVFSDVAMLTETPAHVPRTPVFFETVKGFRVLTRTEAVAIDRDRKIVRIREGNTGTEGELAYDKLVLATGAHPFIPPVEGVDLEHVWTIRRLEDAVTLTEAIEKKGLKKAVLVGAGYIGMEMAEALVKRGLEVTLVDMFDQVMPQFLDRDMALLVEKHLQPNGVKLVLDEKVTALEGDHGVLRRVRTEKQTLEADLAIIAVGVRPNDSLARDAKIQCAPQGGIVINSYCQTSDPDIYAGGDCVVNQYVHPFTGTPLFIPLGSTANKHGRVIANHIAGLPSPFPGVTSTGICRIFDITVGRTGLIEKQAQELNLDVETVIWSGSDRAHYMPEQRPMVIKMIACKRYRKLLGLQVVGPGDGAKRLDVAATAIFFGATLDQIGSIDLAYAPPYGPPIDPIATTAHVLLNKMNGLAHGISPLEAKRIMDDGADVVLLDVRTPDEFRETRLEDPRVVHIPLGALRKRLQELPKDKEILTFCKVSMRGYEAQRILNAAGYDRVRFIEGGLIAWPFA